MFFITGFSFDNCYPFDNCHPILNLYEFIGRSWKEARPANYKLKTIYSIIAMVTLLKK